MIESTPSEPVPDLSETFCRHPTRGRVPVSLDEAIELLEVLATALIEIIEQTADYDEEHPDLWATCSQHPDGDCGQRDLPGFYVTALVHSSDATFAKSFVSAWRDQ